MKNQFLIKIDSDEKIKTMKIIILNQYILMFNNYEARRFVYDCTCNS